MKVATLNRRHPCCDPALFATYDALYRGGAAFRALLKDFLPRNPMEAADVYTLRKRDAAAYRSYVGPIVDFFAAQLFAASFLVRTTLKGADIAADSFYGDFREDVDLGGTDLVAFMKARFMTALVKRSAWWVAELPDDQGIAPEARADWEARGLGRVRLCPIEPDDVLDWEVDDYGALLWAIVHTSEQRRDDPRLERALVTETWKLYDRESVETFTVTYDPKKRRLRPEDEIPSAGRMPHRFPRVPLVQMRLPEGLWLLNRTADAQIEHFRLSAALSWAIKRACYPMAIFKSEDRDKPPVTGAGVATIIGLKESFEWAAPSTAPFDVLDRQLTAQVTELYRIAQQMAHSVDNNRAAAVGRSGESKIQDNAATEICLHAYALLVKEAIESTFELLSDGRDDVDIHFSIEGMNQFSLSDVTAAIANMKAVLDLGIDSATLTKELGAKVADMVLPDAAQPTKDQIRKELEEAAKKPKAPPPPPPGTTTAPPGADALSGAQPPKPNGAPKALTPAAA